LIINNLWWEEGIDITKEKKEVLVKCMVKFSDYLNLDEISPNIYLK